MNLSEYLVWCYAIGALATAVAVARDEGDLLLCVAVALVWPFAFVGHALVWIYWKAGR